MKKLLTIAVVIIGVAGVNAQQTTQKTASQSTETAGFQLALTPDIAIHPKTTTIRGVSLDIWGENPQHSFNLGFVNGSTGKSSGFSWAFIANYADSYTGVAWGIVNISHQKFVGWQGSCVNYSQGYFKGFQSGLVNVAEEAHGLQWGVVNYTESLNGVQIGLVNVIRDNPWFNEFPNKLAKGFPIANWSF
jgi:hypothetical protein